MVELALIEAYQSSGVKQREIGEFRYAADSWDIERRVITRLEYGSQGNNPRFIVTNLQGDPTQLYERLYCQRGEAENRIKEAQLDLFGTRASCHRFIANQFRLLLAALAYTLMHRLRSLALRDTELQHASAATIRVRLLKIGAAILRSTRRVRLMLASHHPLRHVYALAADRLAQGIPQILSSAVPGTMTNNGVWGYYAQKMPKLYPVPSSAPSARSRGFKSTASPENHPTGETCGLGDSLSRRQHQLLAARTQGSHYAAMDQQRALVRVDGIGRSGAPSRQGLASLCTYCTPATSTAGGPLRTLRLAQLLDGRPEARQRNIAHLTACEPHDSRTKCSNHQEGNMTLMQGNCHQSQSSKRQSSKLQPIVVALSLGFAGPLFAEPPQQLAAAPSDAPASATAPVKMNPDHACMGDLRTFSEQIQKDGYWLRGSDLGYGYPVYGYGYGVGHGSVELGSSGSGGLERDYPLARPGYEVRTPPTFAKAWGRRRI